MNKTYPNTFKQPKGRKLPRAKTLRVFELNPAISLSDDMKAYDRKATISKDISVYLLEATSLRIALLFFDANDEEQMAWAKSENGTWILTNGNPFEVKSRELREVHFDKSGFLTKKLGIQSLPAKVTQVGKSLKIEEIPCF